ncbi:MAG: hypothetical protein R3B06_05050 [Kofleriaceae bacterium]
MRIAATIVGTARRSFRETSANADRVDLAGRIARATQKDALDADLVILPAGFFAVKHSALVRKEAARLAAMFPHCSLLAGIDLEKTQLDAELGVAGSSRAGVTYRSKDATHHGKDRRARGRTAGRGYGFWGFAAHRGVTVAGPWQQRTVYPGEETDDDSARLVALGGMKVGVLLCGEVYNVDLRPALQRARPDFVVDLGHMSMGRRFTNTLVNVASAVDANVYHSQHVVARSRDAAKWTATPRRAWAERGHDWASYDADHNPSLWAEIKVWDLGAARRRR